MSVTVTITDGPLTGPFHSLLTDGVGAGVYFEGLVRPTEDNRPLVALEYEAYEPMATQQLEKLAQQTLDEFGLIAIDVQHSRGLVSINECSFRLIIVSAHRKEALQAMAQFIDRMKLDVPIWKKPIFE